jgi:hypothetical protein
MMVIMPILASLLPDIPLPPMPVMPGLALEMPASHPAPGLDVLDSTATLHTNLLTHLLLTRQ